MLLLLADVSLLQDSMGIKGQAPLTSSEQVTFWWVTAVAHIEEPDPAFGIDPVLLKTYLGNWARCKWHMISKSALY